MGDDVISRVEAWLAAAERYDADHIPVNDLRELLALARSNSWQPIDESDLIGAVLAHTRIAGKLLQYITCDISNAKFAIRQVLDRTCPARRVD
jgi:hypothetical protein